MLTFRKAGASDLPEILKLYAQPDMDDGDVLTTEQAERVLERMGQYPDYGVYVAELEGAIVGSFELAVMDNLGHSGSKAGLIEDVVVATHLQGRGIGRRMMAFAVRLCKEKGCYKAALSSNKIRKEAHMFYEHIGFTVHGYSFMMDIEKTSDTNIE